MMLLLAGLLETYFEDADHFDNQSPFSEWLN